MDTLAQFRQSFALLTGNPSGPFPWQERLYTDWFSRGRLPGSCSLPTGVGKTSVVAIWLIALLHGAKVPRRLVYCVNRRTVVDQTTTEVERLKANLSLATFPHCGGLAISTLRGQFADNREWSDDPSRPAVIVGTVDMIGSRLLFSGYGVGFKARPLHAGFLGQDSLLVHDEAHLEPAFQSLLDSIAKEQQSSADPCPLHIMQMTATLRTPHQANSFGLTHEESNAPDYIHDVPGELPIKSIWRRCNATKRLTIHAAATESPTAQEAAPTSAPSERQQSTAAQNTRIAEEIASRATSAGGPDSAVLIFVTTVEDVERVCTRLLKLKVPPQSIQRLTGTMRGWERDRFADPRHPQGSPVFARFLKPPDPRKPPSEQWAITPTPGRVYLVCTSAGEVGIDISADHLVCDLSTWESMLQRFGRVNRYGLKSDSSISIVTPPSFDEKNDKLAQQRAATRDLFAHFRKHYDHANPASLDRFSRRNDLPHEITAAFAPPPRILPVTSSLFDAWAMTSLRKPMPGRPPVGPFLHGIRDGEAPETSVAWRKEVDTLTGPLLRLNPPEDLLDDYPLLPHELLRDKADRVRKHCEQLAKRSPDAPAWLLDHSGTVTVTTLALVGETENKEDLDGKILLLPPSVGGLSMHGTLDAGVMTEATDVADELHGPSGQPNRLRLWDNAPDHPGLRIVRTIDTNPDAIDTDDDPPGRRFWIWCTQCLEGGKTANQNISWQDHVNHVTARAARLAQTLDFLPDDIRNALILAAKLHDHGKRRAIFQLTLGNHRYPEVVLAKSGARAASLLSEQFRHEFASVLDAQSDPELQTLSSTMQDLVLHLIAAHHGRARPHFHPDEAFDPENTTTVTALLADGIPYRFAKLQRQFGRWGLAYLESLLRAADWAASGAEMKGEA
jgi:CRISPR-associated endonuclease/helicase Cas3